jgi:hypothetical protein
VAQSDPTTAALAVLIYITGGRSEDVGILALWRDGFALWSADEVAGGPPYWAGWQAEEKMEETLTAVKRLAEIGRVPARQFFFGPDARWVSLQIFEQGHWLIHLGSWHELFEANPALVATEGGIEPLNGRERDAVLAAQPAEYQAFRHRWQAIKERLLALVPTQRVPYDPATHRPLPW